MTPPGTPGPGRSRVSLPESRSAACDDRSVESQTSGRTLVLVAVFLAMALMLALPVRSWLTQRSQLDELQSQIDAAYGRVAVLQETQRQWQDPAFIEAQARLRLNMVRPGEMGMIVDDQSSSQAPTGDAPPATWYDRLWRSTDSAAGRRPAEIVGGNVQDSPDAQP